MQNNPKHKLEQLLESRILHGLRAEWESASWVLEGRLRERLRQPMFTLRDMRSRLGYWSSEKNEIALSRDFVHNYSWNDVCEVLRHEMAHQYVNQVMGIHDQRAHGPAFQQACSVLRANARASASYQPLSDKLTADDEADQDSIMRKVHKLMALAESQNMHEAEAAMAKANALIAKYNLRLLECERRREYVSAFAGQPALRHFREDYLLAHLLEDYYFVKGLWITAYVLGKGKMGRVLEISGIASNVLIAGYVHDVVKRFIDAEWKRYTRKGKMNRSRKSDFAAGIIAGFSGRLKKQQQQVSVSTPQSTTALVVLDDPQLEDYMQQRYPSTRTFRRKGTRSDPSVMADGKRLGADLLIARGVTLKPDRRIRRLSG